MDHLHYFRVLIILLVTLLLSSNVSSQVTDIKVQIINSPPKAYDVYATSIVKSQATDVVWCTGILEDLNSYKDFKVESAFIGMPSNGGYLQRIDSDLFNSEQTSIIKGTILAGFVVGPQSTAGDWSCVIEGMDNAEDKASNKTSFKIHPSSCGNRVLDSGEENIDCGGSCMPCGCFNGVQDGDETGSDCGGPCKYCQDAGSLILTVPSEITSGEIIPIQVKVENKGMISLIRVIKPSGKNIVFKTDDSGVLSLEADETGIWTINADLYGYAPAKAEVEVKTSIVTYLVGAVIALSIAVLVLVILKGKKKKEETSSL